MTILESITSSIFNQTLSSLCNSSYLCSSPSRTCDLCIDTMCFLALSLREVSYLQRMHSKRFFCQCVSLTWALRLPFFGKPRPHQGQTWFSSSSVASLRLMLCPFELLDGPQSDSSFELTLCGRDAFSPPLPSSSNSNLSCSSDYTLDLKPLQLIFWQKARSWRSACSQSLGILMLSRSQPEI